MIDSSKIQFLSKLSEDQLVELTRREEEYVELSEFSEIPAIILILGSGFGLAYLEFSKGLAKDIVISAVAFIAAAMMGFFWSKMIAHESAKLLGHLQPLSEKSEDACLEALALVKAVPEAREWRDLAISQRRQLRGFDLAQMHALYWVHDNKPTLARRAATCRALHGLT